MNEQKKKETIQKLLKKIREQEDDIRRQNLVVDLSKIEHPEVIPSLRRILEEDESSRVRGTAAALLGDIGDKAIIPVLLERLQKDRKYMTIMEIPLALGKLGKESEEAIAALVEIIRKDEDYEVCYWTARALTELLGKAVPALLKMLREEKDERILCWAIVALTDMGERIVDGIPELLQIMKEDKRKTSRSLAAIALGKKKEHAVEVVPEIVKILVEDKRYLVRISTAEALEEMGENAREAVPALIEIMQKDWRREVREHVVWALSAIGAKEGVEAMIALLKKTKNSLLRLTIVETLAMMKEKAEVAIPVLREVMKKDKDETVRSQAAEALEDLSPVLVKRILKNSHKILKKEKEGGTK